MGALRQLGQLFWKNFVLRKREPHVLILEIIWPIIIFVVVALIRYGSPPINKNTCSYQERAMPSAGMIPFIQTTVCNLDNQCESPEAIQQKETAAGRLSALVGDLQPYLSDQATIEALDSLDTGVKLITGLQRINKNVNITQVLGPDNYQVKKLLRDPEKVKKTLVEDLKLMSAEVAGAFLNSSVNIGKILSSISYIDFRGIVCNKTALEEYMLFRKGVDIATVSNELCTIEDSDIPKITDAVLSELDVAAIIRAAKSLTALTQSYELSDALEDLATMTDLFYGTSTVSNMIKHIPQLKDLPAVMKKLPQWINTIQRLNTIDTDSIDSIIQFVDPIIKDLAPNVPEWNTTKLFVEEIKNVIAAVGDGTNMNWTEIFTTGNNLIEMLSGSSMNTDWLQQAADIPVSDLTSIVDALLSGNTTAISQLPASRSLESLQRLLDATLGKNATSQMLQTSDAVLDLALMSVNYISELDNEMEKILRENSAVMDAFKRLLQKGPNVTLAISLAFLSPTNLQDLLMKPAQYKVICERAVRDSLQSLEPVLVPELQSLLCSDNISSTFDNILKKLNFQNLQREIQKAMIHLDNIWLQKAIERDVTIVGIYEKQTNLTMLVTQMFQPNTYWENMIKSLSVPGVDINDKTWDMTWQTLYTSYVQSSWSAMVLMMGPMLENTTMWSEIGPWMRTMDVVGEYTIDMINQMNSMYDKSSTMGKLMDYAMNYSPEIIEAAMNMMTTDSMLMYEIFTTQDPITLFCDKNMLQRMNLPSYVPVSDMESMLCSTNWTAFTIELMSMYDMTPMVQQIQLYFDKTAGVGSAKGYNWTNMIETVKEVTVMMQNPQGIIPQGPWDMMQNMNFSKISSAMDNAMKKLQDMTMSLNNYTSLNQMIQSGMMTMKQLDTSLQNDNTWRMIKHYIKAWNYQVRYTNRLLSNTAQEVTLQQYLFNMSASLEEYVTKFTDAIPDILTVMKKIVIDPSKIMQNMMSMNWNNICNGSKVTDMLALSPDNKLPTYENYLCKFNWTVILIELMEQDPDLKAYSEQIQLIMTHWDNFPDVMVNWTEVGINTGHYFELTSKAMSGQFLTENLFSNIDMNKINMTWQEFVTVLMQSDQYDVNRLSGMIDGYRSLIQMITNSSGDGIMREIIYYEEMYTYQVYLMLQFQIRQLEYFNSTRRVDLITYINSEEMNKILDVLRSAPDLTSVALNVIIDMMTNQQKVTQLTNSAGQLCSDLTIFKSVISIPANVTLDAAALQSKICGLNINTTKLYEELVQSLTGLEDVVQFLNNPPSAGNVMKVNYSSIMKDYEKMIALVNSLAIHPPNLTIGGSNDWMNVDKYVSQWNGFVKDFTDSLMTANAAATQDSIVTSVVSSMAGIPEMRPILTYMGLYADIVKDGWVRNQAAMVDVMSALQDFPELQKAMTLANDLPYIFQTMMFNSLYHSDKISMMIQSLTGGWDQFCLTNSNAMLVDFPQSNFTYQQFHADLCKLNLTQLMVEGAKFQGTSDIEVLMRLNITTDSPFNLTKVVQQLRNLMNTAVQTSNTTDLQNAKVPQYLNMQIWGDVMNQLNNIINDPVYMQKLQSSSAASFATIMDALSESSSYLQQQLGMYHTIYSMIGMFTQKFISIKNDSVIRMEDLFGNATETIKLWNLFIKPGVLETILYSSSDQKFTQLFMAPNLTEVFTNLCSPSGDFSKYLTVPSHLSVDINMIKSDFCDIDITKIEKEVMSEFNFAEVFMQMNNISTNWTTLNQQYFHMMEIIQTVISNPPQIDLPTRWMNETYWLNMLTKYNQYNIDPQRITDSITSSITVVMDSLAQTNPVIMDQLKMYAAGYSIMGMVLDKLHDAMNGTNLSLESFLGNATETKKLWQLVQKPGVLEVMVYSGNTPESLISTMNMTAAMLKLCHPVTGNLSHYLKAPGYLSVDMGQLQTDLCDIDFMKIESEMMTEFDFMGIISKVYNSSTIDWSYVMSQYQRVNETIMNLIANPPMLELPMRWLNNSYWLDMLTRYGQSYQSSLETLPTDVLKTILPVLNDLAQSNPAIMEQLKMYQVQFRVIAMIIDKMNNDTVLDLGDFLGNSTALSKLWDLMKMPGVFEVLLYSANTPEFSQLLMIPNATVVFYNLCDPVHGDFTKYFTVPSHLSVDLNQLKTEFCSIDITKIMEEVMKEYDIEGIISKIYNSSTVDWKLLLDDYSKMNGLLQRWIMSPPTLNVPHEWLNETFWINMLMKYSESRQQPQVIIKELETFISSLAPLLNQDPFRQYGLFLEGFMDLVYDNLIILNSTNMTLENLAYTVPVLSDMFSTLNISKDLLTTLMTAPIKNPVEFIKLMTSQNPLDLLCTQNNFWHDTFTLPQGSNTMDIQLAFCNSTNDEIFRKILSDLSFSDFIASFDNSTIVPDWKNIIQKSSALYQMAENIISSMNSYSGFDFQSTFNRIISAYNNTEDLWKLMSAFTELSNSLNGTTEVFGVMNSYIGAGKLIVEWMNDVFDNILSQGQHVDLGLLFQNSTTVQRLISVMKELNKDMVAEELIVGFLKPEKTQELITILTNGSQADWLCSESEWKKMFTFPQSFNVSTLVHALCGLNDTYILNDLMKQLNIRSLADALTKISPNQAYDIQSFTTAVQQLSDKLMRMANISSVEFKGLNFDKLMSLNSTYLMSALQAEMANLQSTYPQLATSSLESMFSSLILDPQQSNSLAFGLSMVSHWSKMFTQHLNEITSKPLNLTYLMYRSSLSDVFKTVLEHPEWMEELAHVQVDPQKVSNKCVLSSGKIKAILEHPEWMEELAYVQVDPLKFNELLQAPDVRDKLCSQALWDVMIPHQNSTALMKFQEALCGINDTVLMMESLSGFLADYKFGQEFDALVREFHQGKLVFNASSVTEASNSFTQLMNTLITVLSNPSNITTTEVDTSSWSSVFQRLETILQQLNTDRIVEWASLLFGQLGSLDETTTKSLQTVNVIMKVVNSRLADAKGTITLDSLVKDDYLLKMIKSYLNVNNQYTAAWINEEILLEKVLEFSQNATLFQHLCSTQTLADFITAPGHNSSVAVDLQRIVCFYPDAFLQALQNEADSQYLTQQITQIWNNTYTQPINWSEFNGNMQNFSQLLTELVQQPPVVDSSSWMSLVDFNTTMNAIQSLFTNPDKIFNLLASYNPLMNKEVDAALNPYLTIWDQFYKHMKTLYNDIQGFGCSYTKYSDTQLTTSDGSPMVSMASNTETVNECRYECEKEPMFSSVCVGFLYEPDNGGACVLYMNDSLPNNVIKVPAIGKHYYERNCTGADSSTSNENSILTIFDWVSSLDTMMAVTGGNSRRLLLEQVGQSDQVKTFVCTVSSMQTYISGQLGSDMSVALCGKDPKSWYDSLMDAGFTNNNVDMLYQGIQKYMYAMGIPLPRATTNITWAEFISQIQDVSRMLETMNYEDLFYRLGMSFDSAGSEQQIQTSIVRSFEWLKLLSDNVNSSQSILSLITSVNAYLNKQLNLLQGQGVPITTLLPDSTLLAKLLNETLGHQTAAAILTAYVAPDKFLQLAFSNNWISVVCDRAEFMKTFKFPNGTDVDRIQQDLCMDARSQNSSIRNILSRLDMTDVIKALEDLMAGGTATTVNNTQLWNMIQHQTEELLANIQRLQGLNVNMTGIDTWLKPIIAGIQALQNPSVDSLGSTCDNVISYIKDADIYKNSVQPVLVGILNNLEVTKQQLKLQVALEDILCDISDLNVTDITKTLQEANFTDFIKSLAAPNMSTVGEFQCKKIVSDVNELTASWTNIINELTADNSCIEQCWKNMATLPSRLIKDFSSTFALASQLLEILNDPTVQYFARTSDLLPIMEFFLNTYINQENMSYKISELLTNSTTIEEYLEKGLQLSPEIVHSLFKSTLNLDTIALLNNSAETVTTIFCDPNQLDDIITLPKFINISMVSLSDSLCGPNVGSTVRIIQQFVDIGTLSVLMSNNGTAASSSWWTVMSKHLSDVFQNLGMIGGLANFNVDLNNFNEILPDLQRFIFEFGPEALADSINLLLNDFRQLDNTTELQTLVTDLQTIVKGMTSLRVVRNFIPQNVLLQDVLQDPVAFRAYLINDIGLQASVADAVLGGTIKYTALLKYNYKDIEDTFCNETRLSTILSTPSETVTIANISNSLCDISMDKVVNLTETLLHSLDVGDLVLQYVTLGVDSLMKEINVTREEAMQAVQKLDAAKESLLTAAQVFQNSTKDIDLNFFNSPEALTGGESLSSVSTLVCNLNRSLSLSDTAGFTSKIKSRTTLTEEQKQEMTELPGQFCQDVYRDIHLTASGPIIWKYLKPLLRGKILYTPDTPETRLIMEKINNDSFKILEEVQMMAKSWAAGTVSLNSLLKDNGTLEDVQELLGNGIIDGLLVSMVGVSGTDLINSLYSLNNIDQKQISALSTIAELIANYTECVETDRFNSFDSEQELETHAVNIHKNNKFLAGIVFTNIESGSRKKRNAHTGLPKHVAYKIRMDIENVRHTDKIKEMFWRPYPEDDMFDMRYTRGFIQLQDLIERSIINLQTGQPSHSPSVYLQQFPTPCHQDDRYLSYLSAYLLPVMMTIAWLAAMAVATKNFVYDRELGQEEALKIMGLNSILNWWAWFLCTMLFMIITSVFCILILRFGNLFRYTNFGILLLYFVDFCFSSIMMCYMVSSFFTRTTLAMLTVLIVYLLSYLPYIVLIAMEAQMEFWQKSLACLFSTTAFGFGAQYLARFEIQAVGVQWHNIQSTPIEGDEMNFSWACIMMVIDGIIYLIIGWYIRNVKPGKYGVAQPWYFPVSPYYWGCKTRSSVNKYAAPKGNEVLFESPMANWQAGISLNGVCKKFGKFQAVKNVNAEFYEGQVTALLGHNGAAKTTTLNMITGIMGPTSGNISIYGKAIKKGDNKIGICTQHNALFHYMTVMEHMKFYASVKCDMTSHKIKREIEELLKDVELWHVRHVRASDLSGGMQRRLCVALAFVGGSEAVILDEPTSGVDPSGRRCIWNLIHRRKYRCTILLSTHHLDEADMIGDRVAIMHNGQIMCSGSPMFLKQQLGSGYQLKLVKRDKMDSSTVLTVVRTWIPGAELVEDIGSEMTISLPIRGVSTDSLYNCLFDLDSNTEHLNFGNYGIYDTTMEEVFQKVCTLADNGKPINEETIAEVRKVGSTCKNQDDQKSMESSDMGSNNGSRLGFTAADVRKRVTGISHKMQQFTGLFIKRFHHYRRDWRMIMSLIVFPCLFTLAALGFMTIRPNVVNNKQLIMTPPLYGPDKYVFYKDNVQSSKSQSLMNHLMSPPGIGTTCMTGMRHSAPFKCVAADVTFSSPSNAQTSPGTCTCEDYIYKCGDAARNWAVPEMVTNTTDIMQKLDGIDVTDYLLKTASEYRELRYGGWSVDSDSGEMKARVWFNNKGHHAMPSFYNAFSNILLRSSVNSAVENPAEYGITLYNQPISLSKQQLNQDTILENAADIGVALVFVVAFTFVPVGIIMYMVNEYKRKEKQLQFVSGVGPLMYWFSAFIWDMLAFCLAVALTVVIMAIFRSDPYWARENLQAVVVLLILYGWASIPWMYSTVKIFKDATSAYMVLFVFNMFIGITTMVTAFVLNFFQNQGSIKSAYEVLRYIFLIFPPYSLGDGLVKLITNQIQANIFSQFGQDVYESPFTFDLLGWHFVALGIEGFVFAVITLLVELRCECKTRLPSSLEEELYKESEEVSNERSRVLSGFAKDDVVTVNNLSKVYRRSGKSFLAVDHLTFGVPKAECFGLLGINGAGKTTTFRMLTGDIMPSDGAAYLKGSRISRGQSNLGQEVGYCPQEDALDLYLTGRELLHCHARLRGLTPEGREQAVESLISKLKMTYADKVINKYSGGMKRQLMVAISLLGEPPVVFMDEPTTGMDPSTKRTVWNAVISAIKNGQSIILTSHSMEECDTLCTRLAIMVNGEFKCLGSPQQLKDKYGDGYTVLLYMTGLSTNKHSVADFIHANFPGSMIRDQYQGVLQIDIPKGSTSVANILHKLEEEKQNYNIIHYSVSQTTLDNVFLNFARDQNDGMPPEFNDSWSRSASGSDSGNDTHLSEPFTNLTYAYMNPGFDPQKDDKLSFGPEHQAKLMSMPGLVVLSEEDLITKL